MLEGPTAIAFVETEGNPAAVAKALSDTARETKILTLRGGILSGKTITGAEIESLAKLPPLEVLQAQLVGVIVAPLTQLVAVLNAPLQNFMGLIDARITQLEQGGDTSGAAAAEAAAAEDAAVADEASAASPPSPRRSRRGAVAEAAADEPAVPRRLHRGARGGGGRAVDAEEPVEDGGGGCRADARTLAEAEAAEPAAEASENTEPEKNEEE